MKSHKRLILDTLLLGVVGALSAQLFTFLLHVAEHFLLNGLAGYRPPGLLEEGGVLQQVIGLHGLWSVPIVTTIGGLLSGLLVLSAKSTFAFAHWLAYYEVYTDVHAALAREKQIKNWRREKKVALIEMMNPTWKDLSLEWEG